MWPARCTAACTCGSTTSGSARSCRGRCATTRPTTSRSGPPPRCRRIEYPKYDGVLTFDKLSSVFISNTNHEEDQPSHLQLRDPAIPVTVNLARLRRPRAALLPGRRVRVRRCAKAAAGKRLQINAQNCVHCKTCDIKDPRQNIHWVPPEGGGGPNYSACAAPFSGGHSHAAPRTPLESPCALRHQRACRRGRRIPSAPQRAARWRRARRRSTCRRRAR